MNSCLQCLYKVPELREALVAASASTAPLTREGSKLFKDMAKGVTVSPFTFWAALRSDVPQFDEMAPSKVPGGGRGFKQQDAEECWTAVCRLVLRCALLRIRLPEVMHGPGGALQLMHCQSRLKHHHPTRPAHPSVLAHISLALGQSRLTAVPASSGPLSPHGY